MELSSISSNPLYETRLGIIFYFYQDPEKIKVKIKRLLKDFKNLSNKDYIYYSHNSLDEFKNIPENGVEFLEKEIGNMDFNESQHLIAVDSTKERMHTIRVEMMLRTIKEDFKSKTPNWIYFELSPYISYSEVLSFVKNAFYDMTYHYSCCNFVIGQNDNYLKRSSSYAIKALKETSIFNDQYSILFNPSLLKSLKDKIDGPNYIQVLSKELYEKIGFENIFNKCEEADIYYEFGEDYVIFSLSKDKLIKSENELFEKYVMLNELISPIIGEIDKPIMYWDDDEWVQWRNRFLDKSKDVS
ncbi:hypothetical protein ACQPU1_02555 [Clostridium paraputrificum]|uniref:hypothetical protein n=1 Tax=Clostridium TaxID=1485 RepID=UPI003D34192A